MNQKPSLSERSEHERMEAMALLDEAMAHARIAKNLLRQSNQCLNAQGRTHGNAA